LAAAARPEKRCVRSAAAVSASASLPVPPKSSGSWQSHRECSRRERRISSGELLELASARPSRDRLFPERLLRRLFRARFALTSSRVSSVECRCRRSRITNIAIAVHRGSRDPRGHLSHWRASSDVPPRARGHDSAAHVRRCVTSRWTDPSREPSGWVIVTIVLSYAGLSTRTRQRRNSSSPGKCSPQASERPSSGAARRPEESPPRSTGPSRRRGASRKFHHAGSNSVDRMIFD